MGLNFRQRVFFCTPQSQLSPTRNTYKYYPDFHIKLFLMDKFNVSKQPSGKLFLLRHSMDVLGTGNTFLGRSVWITDCLVLLPLQTIGGEKWFPLDWAFCTAWKALMDLWTFFKNKGIHGIICNASMNVKKKVVTFKRLLMGRTIQRNQHNFFQMFRSIWVSALEFGRKSMAEVILLLCLWKIISRTCWGGLHANGWLMARFMNIAVELWNCYGWKWPLRPLSLKLGSCLGTGL